MSKLAFCLLVSGFVIGTLTLMFKETLEGAGLFGFAGIVTGVILFGGLIYDCIWVSRYEGDPWDLI